MRVLFRLTTPNLRMVAMQQMTATLGDQLFTYADYANATFGK